MDDDNKSVTILPEGSEVSDDIKIKSDVIGFLREDKTIFVEGENGKIEFASMSEFFKYVGDQ